MSAQAVGNAVGRNPISIIITLNYITEIQLLQFFYRHFKFNLLQ
jgi:hypothetical protein